MGGKTAQTQSQVTIPPEVLARYNSVNAQAQQAASTPFQSYSSNPDSFVAPINSEQQAGIGALNGAANSYQPYYSAATSTLGGATNAGLAGTAAAAQPLQQGQSVANGLQGASAGLAAAGSGAVDPSQLNIGQYMSPYLQTVLSGTLNPLIQQQQQQQSALQGNQIMQGTFGGDRGGIDQAVLGQQQNLALAQTASGILNEGYNNALGAAQQQQGVGLSAAQANRSALQEGSQLLGGLGQQVYGQGLGTSQQDAALAQQGYGMGANTASSLAALGTGTQQAGLAGAQAQIGAGTLQQQTSQAGLSALYNQFLQQQGYPFQVDQFLANIAEGTGALSGSTTTSTQPVSSFLKRGGRAGYAEGGAMPGFDINSILGAQQALYAPMNKGLTGIYGYTPQSGPTPTLKTVDAPKIKQQSLDQQLGGLTKAFDTGKGLFDKGSDWLSSNDNTGTGGSGDDNLYLDADNNTTTPFADGGRTGKDGGGGLSYPLADTYQNYLAQQRITPFTGEGLYGNPLITAGVAGPYTTQLGGKGEGLHILNADAPKAAKYKGQDASHASYEALTAAIGKAKEKKAGGGRIHRDDGGMVMPYAQNGLGYVPEQHVDDHPQLAVAKAPDQQGGSGLNDVMNLAKTAAMVASFFNKGGRINKDGGGEVDDDQNVPWSDSILGRAWNAATQRPLASMPMGAAEDVAAGKMDKGQADAPRPDAPASASLDIPEGGKPRVLPEKPRAGLTGPSARPSERPDQPDDPVNFAGLGISPRSVTSNVTPDGSLPDAQFPALPQRGLGTRIGDAVSDAGDFIGGLDNKNAAPGATPTRGPDSDWMSRNQSWLIPLLKGVGASTLYPGKSLVGGLTYGAMKGAESYADTQNQMAERNLTGAETQATQSGVYKPFIQVGTLPNGQPNLKLPAQAYADSQNTQAGASPQNVSRETSPPAIGGPQAPQTPQPPRIFTGQIDQGGNYGVAFQPSVGGTIADSIKQVSGGQLPSDPAQLRNYGMAVASMPSIAPVAAKEGEEAIARAQQGASDTPNTRIQLNDTTQQMLGAGRTGITALGAGAKGRVSAVNAYRTAYNIFPEAAAALGLPKPDAIDPKDNVAATQILEKLSQFGGLQIAAQNHFKAASLQETLAHVLPSLEMQPEAASDILSNMYINNQREADFAKYSQAYNQKFGTYYGVQNAFNQDMSSQYARDKNSLMDAFQRPGAGGMTPYMKYRENRGVGLRVLDGVYGNGFSRYFEGG